MIEHQMLAALARLGVARIHSVRAGHACNSSSTHSIVLLPPGQEHSADQGLEPGEEYFGDHPFLAAGGEAKLRYYSAVLAGLNEPEARRVADHVLERAGLDRAADCSGLYDDILPRPRERWTGRLDQEFLRELAVFLDQPGVAIVGSGDGHDPHHDPAQIALYGVLRPRREVITRKDVDPVTGESWWVMYDSADGTRVRFSLDLDAIRAGSVPDGYRHTFGGYVPSRSPFPELVDVKLTDRCPYEADCGFCYMASTVAGQEGRPHDIAKILDVLAGMGVFEVAFGGGEPTAMPRFGQILAATRSRGITPNFTTKNYGWLRRPDKVEQWLGQAGAVAFSVNSIAEAQRFVSCLQDYQRNVKDEVTARGQRLGEITVQTIPEVAGPQTLRHILSQAKGRFRVTLLGYKATGRGRDHPSSRGRRPGWWIDTVQAAGLTCVGIDTVLAAQSREQLTAAEIPSWMFQTEEGRFSAYVDAVTARMGPSSFCPPEQMSALDLSRPTAELIDRFAGVYRAFA
ncbi:radical SAM protein [Bailinhaonella thermotolerans]|uniref:Radical SAM protein n=1 Tax=Bailinhaonella thermotolerans TaxID=1070861 RepID=A0A3A4AAN7_9ACTN|nr:radical SAM protein [Bailinhaonella thermotolerans]RJL23897.1 radical SAM protein [Bailinhaonella thermotolerans]